jgi:hypothetical protein
VTPSTRVIGSFADEEGCARAVAALRVQGIARPRVFSPFASECIAEALHTQRSPVRRWLLAGGICGCASGFALTIGLAIHYPRMTAGMPIVSIPPFVIIAFELTILFGALSGVLGFLVHAGFPRFEPERGYDPRFSNDRFGVVVECAAGDRPRIEALLYAAGAVEMVREPAGEL